MVFYDQSAYDVRCEWGLQGLRALRDDCEVVIIVDVLSFSSCVEAAVTNGALIYPYGAGAQQARAYAASLEAELAGFKPGEGRYWLSPTALSLIPPGTRLVLPSPNGSALSVEGGVAHTIAGCLRNARAVARAAERLGSKIAVIPAGERWPGGGTRPVLEDLLGAGAIVRELGGSRSPEAQAAQVVFERFSTGQARLERALLDCSSGRELLERDRRADVLYAAEWNVGMTVPLMIDGAYRRDEPDGMRDLDAD
jgi:2-phosphosulfolactate phosphatase